MLRPWRCLSLCFAASLLVVLVPPSPSWAASEVAVKDNKFDPKELHVDLGETVVWSNQGSRTHDIKADDGDFHSGDMDPGDTFSYEFDREGYFFYHCTYHGAKGQIGMWGVVIVGDPPPPPTPGESPTDARHKLVVPDDFPTIQEALDHARRGSTVVIEAGTYNEAVVVRSSDIVIKGADRFRTVLDGEGRLRNGIMADGLRNVTVKNLTVRDYTSNGVFFNNVTGYAVEHVDSIKNHVYGLYAFDSYEGIFKNSFAWGSGDAGIYVGQCIGCAAVIDNVHSAMNLIGYSGTNATGVVIRESSFVDNAVGIMPNSLPLEGDGPNRGTDIVSNIIKRNNNAEIEAASIWQEIGVPTGTGVWLFGVDNNVVRRNSIRDNERYGVLVSQGLDPDGTPSGNRVVNNYVRASSGYDLAWDGAGTENCFSGNDIGGMTAPPEAQTLYACDAGRPVVGVPYPPVQADLAAAMATGQMRGGSEAPEPKRPRCQKGRAGCNR